MREEVYRLEGVSFSYGGVPALEDVGFTVARGESLAVLGANGSGKSTLMKVLDGLLFPGRGKVEFYGRTLTEDVLSGGGSADFRARVGFIFPEPDVQLFCTSVYEEVAFGPLQLGLGEAQTRSRVDSLLDMLGLAGLKDRPPYALSTGEKKKVAIASVLSINPEVLLLDEPTNGLDPRTQVWLYELLGELKGLGKTLIICTHDLSLAEDISERVIIIDESHRVAADGPASRVLRDKALLLGANIIHEHAHRHGDITHIHSHGPFATHDEHE
ncbi:MAG: energy-coupling factor ABC transporter ATP-binding protein [Thermodesulfobacteriota bacterium]